MTARLNTFKQKERDWDLVIDFMTNLEMEAIEIVKEFVSVIVYADQTKVSPDSVRSAITFLAGFVGPHDSTTDIGYDFVKKCANGVMGRLQTMKTMFTYRAR